MLDFRESFTAREVCEAMITEITVETDPSSTNFVMNLHDG